MDLLAEAEIFKKIAWTGFWGGWRAHNSLLIRSCPARHSHKTVSRMPACGNEKLMRTCLRAVIAEERTSIPEDILMKKSILLTALITVGLAIAPLAPAALADDMKKDTMSKDNMSKDSMKKDSMAKDNMSKDSMKKDSMSKDNMSKDDAKK